VSTRKRRLLLGNEAIARGLIESGCTIATSYPGTPASEILAAVAYFQNEESLCMHTQWAVNEKVAFEIAYAGCQTGLRAAVSMKQVGLNVASDPLMSAAYMGINGGFVLISADDPGPHSSQTEQDSRLMAMFAKIPVLDPDSPRRKPSARRSLKKIRPAGRQLLNSDCNCTRSWKKNWQRLRNIDRQPPKSLIVKPNPEKRLSPRVWRLPIPKTY
jgi:TPP-dependent indolepyruvate ferredoxin oxidoreductase alpha subunit